MDAGGEIETPHKPQVSKNIAQSDGRETKPLQRKGECQQERQVSERTITDSVVQSGLTDCRANQSQHLGMAGELELLCGQASTWLFDGWMDGERL
jgi:hypothetical protein